MFNIRDLSETSLGALSHLELNEEDSDKFREDARIAAAILDIIAAVSSSISLPWRESACAVISHPDRRSASAAVGVGVQNI